LVTILENGFMPIAGAGNMYQTDFVSIFFIKLSKINSTAYLKAIQ